MARQASMATWRNGSAFGFDCRRYQKVAGSSPAVVIFYYFDEENHTLLCARNAHRLFFVNMHRFTLMQEFFNVKLAHLPPSKSCAMCMHVTGTI